MRPRNCRGAFDEGLANQASHPLPHGEYKLREFRYRTERMLAELVRIRSYKSGRANRWVLQQCTEEDIYIWLRALPATVSYRIAYDLLPSIEALRFDGVDAARIDPVLSFARRQAEEVVGALEDVRQVLKQRIGVEYDRMRNGDPMLEPLVDRLICIADDALSALGLPPEHEVL